jgi:predicted ABC-type ATPase
VASRRAIQSSPRCVVIAGPNGAGKTTFAREYLLQETDIVHFINADLIAAGLSPLAPAGAALRAGRLVISEIERLSRDRQSFAFESTLSGRRYVQRFRSLKTLGYKIEFVYLRVASPKLALKRIASRVKQGGHDVPKADVVRRFERSWKNFIHVYQPLADAWAVYENSGKIAVAVERGP